VPPSPYHSYFYFLPLSVALVQAAEREEKERKEEKKRERPAMREALAEGRRPVTRAVLYSLNYLAGRLYREKREEGGKGGERKRGER